MMRTVKTRATSKFVAASLNKFEDGLTHNISLPPNKTNNNNNKKGSHGNVE